MSSRFESPPLDVMIQALAKEQRQALHDEARSQIGLGGAASYCLRYVADQHWTVVGHQFQLLVSTAETVTVDVLARDKRGDFLAISPVELDGQFGIGIVNLCTAEAHFARMPGITGRVN